MTRHLITRGADHGVFDFETACGLTVQTNDPSQDGFWEFEEVSCIKCKEYIDSKNPICVLCGVLRAPRDYCNTCCRKHFDEQRAKYPGLNPMYWDPMPGENHDNASNDYKEMYRKARDKLGYK